MAASNSQRELPGRKTRRIIGETDLEKSVIALKNARCNGCGIVSVPITVPVMVGKYEKAGRSGRI
jgi:hypothetical protein